MHQRKRIEREAQQEFNLENYSTKFQVKIHEQIEKERERERGRG
jgi:hypothetical protein